jgi:hypothetical protein
MFTCRGVIFCDNIITQPDTLSTQRSFINPLKLKLIEITFKNSVHTAKKNNSSKIDWLMLFKEIIAVYYENCRKPIHKKQIY